MVESSVPLTEDEAELYDRQIRLWGIDSQARLRKARVLVIGLDGLGAEIVKNIVLSGVGSVTLLDDNVATEEDLKTQFLIPHESIGQNRAEASLQRAQVLNPLVSVTCKKESYESQNSDFVKNFDIIISCNQLLSLNLKIDSECRKNNVGFFTCSVFGTFGFVFTDLQDHVFTAEKALVLMSNKNEKLFYEETLKYPSLKESLEVDIKSPELAKIFRWKPSYLFMRVVLKFQEENGRDPTSSESDIASLTKIRDSLLEKDPRLENYFPEVIIRCFTTGLSSPICAIIGAVASQQVVRTVSKKDPPYLNFFFFDPMNLGGYVNSMASGIKCI